MDTLNNMDVMDLLPPKKVSQIGFPCFSNGFPSFFRWPLIPIESENDVRTITEGWMKEMVHELDFHREAVKIHGESELEKKIGYLHCNYAKSRETIGSPHVLSWVLWKQYNYHLLIISKSPKLHQVENLREVRRGLKAAGVNVVVPTEVEGTRLKAWGIIPNTNDIPMTYYGVSKNGDTDTLIAG